jgi:hypothetical protein
VDFALTMTIRRYHWSTDRDRDQYHFLNSVAKVYKTYTKQDIPELINFTPAAPPMSASGPAGEYLGLGRSDTKGDADVQAEVLVALPCLRQAPTRLSPVEHPCNHPRLETWI